MGRNILLIEPNYKNKFPPIALMKLATYFKTVGDNVVFYKGEIKDFILERAVEKCINKLNTVAPHIKWRSKHEAIAAYIKTRKICHLEAIGIDNDEEYAGIALGWLIFYKDYIWKKFYLREEEKEWDWIGVTTLFTFYFDITVKTINEVKLLLRSTGHIMVGGVLATLQPNELKAATGITPVVGLLNKPGMIDEGNELIIDTLPLDYSILEEIDYRYDMSNAYYGSMTKGCVRHCAFCAVPKIEPEYQQFIPMSERIKLVKEKYGEQRNLLLMDNNVLASEKFEDIINDIIKAGFGKGSTYEEPNRLKFAVDQLKEGSNNRAYLKMAQREYVAYLNSLKRNKNNEALSYKVYSVLYDFGLLALGTCTIENAIEAYPLIAEEYEHRLKLRRPKQRVVDFNQGVDARLFTEKKAELLSKICVSPLRVAFDSLSVKDEYIQALTWSRQYGIRNFSNYLLYNFNDRPDDLYERLEINVKLCTKLDANIYSFPMKYHPLYGNNSHDRDFIGKHWNRKYIRSVQAVLNSTKGSIGRGESYFYKAFGCDKNAFHLLLDMPDTYIIYRYFFEWLKEKRHPMSTYNWEQTYNNLSPATKEEFLHIIHDSTFTAVHSKEYYSGELAEIMKFYVNLRDAVQNPDGELFKLKQEYDMLSSVHARRAIAMQNKRENID